MNTDGHNSSKREMSNHILKEEIDHILNGADLTKYAAVIVKSILAEKYELDIENRKAEIESIVTSWLKDREYRINIEHGYLEDIIKQQASMKKQLDKLTTENNLIREIWVKLCHLNNRINRMSLPRELRPSHYRYTGLCSVRRMGYCVETDSIIREMKERTSVARIALFYLIIWVLSFGMKQIGDWIRKYS